LKSGYHLLQLINLPDSEFKFQKYDYGTQKNLQLYGTEHPVEYDLTTITTEVILIAGTEDGLAPAKDVKGLADVLSKETTKLIWMQKWNHVTNLFGKDCSPLFKLLDKEVLDEEQQNLLR